MKIRLPVTYMSCQSCASKIHCDQCDAELAESLVQRPGIQNPQVNIKAKELVLDTTLDADDLEDILEGVGLFLL